MHETLIQHYRSVTAEVLRANIGSKSAISLHEGRLTQNFR